MAKLSITRRLIASLLLMQFVLTVAIVSIAIFATRRQLERSFDAALFGRAMSIAALVRFSEDEKGKLEFDAVAVPPPLYREFPDIFRIELAKTSQLIATSGTASEKLGRSPTSQPHWSVVIDGREYRVVQLRNLPVLDKEGADGAAPPALNVFYASSTEEIHRRLYSMIITSALGALGLLSLFTAVTVWVIRGGLSPLSQLAESASRVTPETWKLDAAGSVRETEELAPLAETMDAMLGSLERAFNAQRDFIANAAHEWKTPIAVLKSTLQLSLQRPRTAEEYRAQLESALQDVLRLEALSHSMLRLARAERMQARDRSSLPEVDLAESCENAAQRLRPIAEARQVNIVVKSTTACSLHAEPEDLEMIWSNLLENAIRYSAAGMTIEMRVARVGRQCEVRVVDRGIGIHADDLPKIFERFQRADDSRSRETGGYGLGLAIVKAMVEAYGGAVRAESEPGNGTTIIVLFA